MRRLDDTVLTSSTLPITAAGASLGASGRRYPFLNSTHPLFSFKTNLDSVLCRPVSATDQQILAEYLVVAMSWHSLEGWRCLSQAASALLAGARQSAIHLAYYAELRAARSILAGSGICIRDGLHFGLDRSGQVLTFGAAKSANSSATAQTIRDAIMVLVSLMRQKLSRGTPNSNSERTIGTHVAAARALKMWSRSVANGERVVAALRGLRFGGIDWVAACQMSGMRDVIIANWLRDWSMDLRKLDKDSVRRNTASYGVSLDTADLDPVRENELRLVAALNESCLSMGTGDVDVMDVALLRDFVVKSADVISESQGRAPLSRSLPSLWVELETQLTGPIGVSDAEAREAILALQDIGKSSAMSVLISAASRNEDALGIMARAFLLLRLATALQVSQWRAMALRSPGGILTWQDELLCQYAVHSHLGAPSITRADFRDLEEDQSEALDDLELWLASGPLDSLATWRQRSEVLQTLCRFERALLLAAAS